jgi:hypothetical protein
LGQERPISPLYSSLSGANAVVSAQQPAQSELADRNEHQRLLPKELSHRVKNALAVVQSLIMRTLSDQRLAGEAREIQTKRVLVRNADPDWSRPSRSSRMGLVYEFETSLELVP